MTRRERLDRCYRNQELDRPGVYSRTGFPGNDPTYDRLRAYLSEHTELKGSWSGVGVRNAPPVEHRTEPYSEDFTRRVTVVHTPAGDLQSTRLESTKGQPGLHETFLLKTREDAQRYLSLPVPEFGGDASGFFKAQQEFGERGIVDTGLGFNAAGLVAELFGSMNFALMSVTERDVLHSLCERRNAALTRQIKFLLDAGVGPYFSMAGQEYIVPPLHGPKDFYDFNVRYDKPVIDLLHDAGGLIHIHCHGSLKAVFQGFVDMGTDALHPFEAPPMGDITPAEAKKRACGKMCLEGNIQIADMYESTPKQVKAQTEGLIETAFDDRRGLIVSPTASPYIRGAGEKCFPQYRAMIDTVLAWKA